MRGLFTGLLILLAAGLMAGCSKCDPWLFEKPAACRSDAPVR